MSVNVSNQGFKAGTLADVYEAGAQKYDAMAERALNEGSSEDYTRFRDYAANERDKAHALKQKGL